MLENLAKPCPLTWDGSDIPAKYHPMLQTLSDEYPIIESHSCPDGSLRLKVTDSGDGDHYAIQQSGRTVLISCGSLCAFGRALGTLLSGLTSEGGMFQGQLSFKTLGIMLDVSRNAVMKPDHFKGWLRRLCLMGYNLAMLYTEDTYEVPDEEYFGYLRGKYSAEELKDIDSYAASLGIEMIGCIQTLGHMEQVLKWNIYEDHRDNERVLLIDEEKTYDLIDKTVKQMAECFRSRRLHVGMDEAWGMGRGGFLLKNGYQPPYDIFNRHIAKVIDICQSQGMAPMIWGDMYTHIANEIKQSHGGVFPPDIKNEVPEGVELVFWNYYSPREDIYEESFDFYRQMGCEPIMASGVWTWGNCFWYRKDNTEKNVAACLNAMKTSDVNEVFFTMWGDDGGYCEYDSSLAGLAYSAELCWGGSGDNRDALAKRFAVVCGSDYEAIRKIADMNRHIGPASIMWDDPIQRMLWKQLTIDEPEKLIDITETYKRILEIAEQYEGETEPVDFDHILQILRLLSMKVELNRELDISYPARDDAGLQAIVQMLPSIEEQVERVLASFRRQWYRRNRPQGFEVLQIRFAGLKARFQELGTRLRELLSDTISTIPELDEVPTSSANKGHNWHQLATSSNIL